MNNNETDVCSVAVCYSTLLARVSDSVNVGLMGINRNNVVVVF